VYSQSFAGTIWPSGPLAPRAFLSATRERDGRGITALRARYKCGKGCQTDVDCIGLSGYNDKRGERTSDDVMIATALRRTTQQVSSWAHAQENPPKCKPARFQEGSKNLLADEKYVDSAEVKDVEKRERGKPVICWVLAGVKLQRRSAWFSISGQHF
jgi:hypothetical protein